MLARNVLRFGAKEWGETRLFQNSQQEEQQQQQPNRGQPNRGQFSHPPFPFTLSLVSMIRRNIGQSSAMLLVPSPLFSGGMNSEIRGLEAKVDALEQKIRRLESACEQLEMGSAAWLLFSEHINLRVKEKNIETEFLFKLKGEWVEARASRGDTCLPMS